MYVYIRWYENNHPKTQPQRMESEGEAKAAVLARFPAATFSERTETVHQPTGSQLSGIDEMMFAWPGPGQPGVQPIADILFPAN
jgi:hypothetical protein